jgi:hypothetical protein
MCTIPDIADLMADSPRNKCHNHAIRIGPAHVKSQWEPIRETIRAEARIIREKHRLLVDFDPVPLEQNVFFPGI